MKSSLPFRHKLETENDSAMKAEEQNRDPTMKARKKDVAAVPETLVSVQLWYHEIHSFELIHISQITALYTNIYLLQIYAFYFTKITS